MRKTIGFAGASILSMAVSAQAGLLVYEGFDYTNSGSVDMNGQTAPLTAGGNFGFVPGSSYKSGIATKAQPGSLHYGGSFSAGSGVFPSIGGKVRSDIGGGAGEYGLGSNGIGADPAGARPFGSGTNPAAADAVAAGTYYYSFLWSNQNASSPARGYFNVFASVPDVDMGASNAHQDGIGIRFTAGQFAVNKLTGGASVPGTEVPGIFYNTVAAETVFLIVGKAVIDGGNSTNQIWVNPTTFAADGTISGGGASTVAALDAAAVPPKMSFGSRANGGAGNNDWYVDEVRVGTSLFDVVVAPAPLPPTWNINASGDWNTAANWLGGVVPNASGATAVLGGITASAQTISSATPIALGTLKFDNANAYDIAGAGSLTMQTATGLALIDVQQGSHTISLPVTFASDSSITAATGASLLISGATAVDAGKTVTKTGALSMTGGLTLGAGSKLVINSGSTSLKGAPTLASDAAIDVKANTLTIDYSGASSPAAAIKALLTSGYNAGAWDGFGINTSSAASGKGLGWKDNAGTSSITVRFTYYGDTNLDAVVNFDDLLALAQAYGASGNWSSGDSDYNGLVEFDDLLKLAQNYGLSLSQSQLTQLNDVAGESFAQDWALAASLAPEPASLSLIALGTAALKRRRR